MFAGSKDRRQLVEISPLETAWILDSGKITPERTWVYDIGLIKTSANAPFFTRGEIRHDRSPICLGAIDIEFLHDDFTSVGWGRRYDEYPPRAKKHPSASSCMKNGVGPKQWRFEDCDMDMLSSNNWECEKKLIPEGYE